jgi:hypothetical protein
MKYICLGYIEPGTFERITEGERHAVLERRWHIGSDAWTKVSDKQIR